MNLKLRNLIIKKKQVNLFLKNDWKLFFQLSNLDLDFLRIRKNIEFLTFSKFLKIKNSIFKTEYKNDFLFNILFKNNVVIFFNNNFYYFIKGFYSFTTILHFSLFYIFKNKINNYPISKLKKLFEKNFCYLDYQNKFFSYFYILFFYNFIYFFKIFSFLFNYSKKIFLLKKNANN